MNGIEAAPRLKRVVPETPIVLLTSYESALEGFNLRKVGIDVVIPKNGDLSLLLDSVQGLLEEA
jgi:DNA-binding NarL/FixJ family response regulator